MSIGIFFSIYANSKSFAKWRIENEVLFSTKSEIYLSTGRTKKYGTSHVTTIFVKQIAKVR